MTTNPGTSGHSRFGFGARLSADIGGTFTDVVLESDGARWSSKTLTTHEQPETGLLAGVDDLMRQSGLSYADVRWFVHGTTLPTNALLERRGAKTALITTEGFRDVLEIGTEGRHSVMDLNLVRTRPLIERPLRFTVPERMSATGEVLLPLDEAAVVAAAAECRAQGVESVAVGFLHAYLDGRHEERVAELLARHLPGVPVSISSRICPEIREYDRFSTTAVNAYVRPIMEGYLDRLAARLTGRGMGCPILMMASNGGVMPLDMAREMPVLLIESGPAGGAVLAASVAREICSDDVFSFDMGGTTAKICFIRDQVPHVTRVFEADRAERFAPGSGLPVRVPVVELIEIGAGGGSIAWIDRMGRVKIGPRSAGSEPGPACYGRGGTDPTITDANLALGRLSETGFAGGRMRLYADRAETALTGAGLGSRAFEAAAGVIEIVDETMANAARAHATELGVDLERQDMIAFGGAAPLHAARLAEKLGIARVIVPASAGVGSAIGFLRAPIASDIVIARPQPLSAVTHDSARPVLARILERAREVTDALGLPIGDVARAHFADLRYKGQGAEIEVPFDPDGEDLAGQLSEGFGERYAAQFGRTLDGLEIELVSWRLRLSAQVPAPGVAQPCVDNDEAPTETRSFHDARTGTLTRAAVVPRQGLRPGVRHSGPALVVEDQTTTVVPPGFAYGIDGFGHLVLERCPEGSPA